MKYRYSFEYCLLADGDTISFRENIDPNINKEDLKKKIFNVVKDYSQYVLYRVVLYRYKDLLIVDIGGLYDEMIGIDFNSESFEWFIDNVLKQIKE